jgi:hypothetical protein
MGLAPRSYLKRLIVVVAACVADRHGELLKGLLLMRL